MADGRRCAVTGANGFVGAHVVRELLGRGHDVVALVGSDLGVSALDGLPVELREVDVRDPGAVQAALRGTRTIVHTAATYAFWAPDRRDIYRVNVEGTRHVLAAARLVGATRIVHTSSTATLSPTLETVDDALREGDEDGVFDLRRTRGHYKMSKAMAEVLALREAARGLPVVIVQPTTVIGPGDSRPTPSGSLIQHYLNGRMQVVVDMRQNVVDVRDVAAGMALALEQAPPGERYILGGGNLSMRALLALLAELTGIPAPRVPLPLPLLHTGGAVNEWLADHVTGRPPLASREQALHARDSRYVSSGKATRELGYAPRPPRAALAAAVQYFASEGFCPPAVAERVLRRPELVAALEA